MSAKEIKRLMNEYNQAYGDADYAGFMARKSRGKKKSEYEEEESWAEQGMELYANKIKDLKPSKYLLNKYPELQDILESI